ncbi:MAG: DUF3303 family protein [Saprospiraceae bacterium]|nr:DUF3303 family protein [Saprospiraceae bacterium]
MKFHVTARTFENITEQKEIQELQKMLGKKINQLKSSDSMIDGGVFVDQRGAYFILECDSEKELFELITPMQDFSHIEVHPLIAFNIVQEFFEKNIATAGSMN